MRSCRSITEACPIRDEIWQMRGDGIRDNGYMYGTKVGCQDYGVNSPFLEDMGAEME